MLPAAVAERGYRLLHRPVVGSTNAELLMLARAGEPDGLWLVADRQTEGRGRRGRSWSSPEGNLYASLLLVAPCEPRIAGQIALVAGLAAIGAIDRVAGPRVDLALKWPNDILLGGAKLAGILVEGLHGPGGFAAVLGIGINCASQPDDLPYAATHLAAVAGPAATRDALFAALALSVADTLALWARGDGFPAIRRGWLQRSLPPGTGLSVARPQGRLEGRFSSIDGDGRLILDTDRGLVTVEAGDVFLADRGMTAAS